MCYGTESLNCSQAIEEGRFGGFILSQRITQKRPRSPSALIWWFVVSRERFHSVTTRSNKPLVTFAKRLVTNVFTSAQWSVRSFKFFFFALKGGDFIDRMQRRAFLYSDLARQAREDGMDIADDYEDEAAHCLVEAERVRRARQEVCGCCCLLL